MAQFEAFMTLTVIFHTPVSFAFKPLRGVK